MASLIHRGSPARLEAWLWLAQRASAAVLVLCVLVHLATIIVVTRGGLTAAEILGRTHASASWASFYGVFVLAVAVHAPLGLRPILAEWAGWRGRTADSLLALFAVVLLVMGFRAIFAVTGGT